MKIIFLENHHPDALKAVRLLTALDHTVLHTDCTSLAQVYARIDPPDLVIAALFPDGTAGIDENGLSVAMAAQFHNSDVMTILLSDSAVFGQGELFAMLTSLCCVLPRAFCVNDLVETAQYFINRRSADKGEDKSVEPVATPTVLGDFLARETFQRTETWPMLAYG